ncbi:hypothetical protein [Persephonella sp.]
MKLQTLQLGELTNKKAKEKAQKQKQKDLFSQIFSSMLRESSVKNKKNASAEKRFNTEKNADRPQNNKTDKTPKTKPADIQSMNDVLPPKLSDKTSIRQSIDTALHRSKDSQTETDVHIIGTEKKETIGRDDAEKQIQKNSFLTADTDFPHSAIPQNLQAVDTVRNQKKTTQKNHTEQSAVQTVKLQTHKLTEKQPETPIIEKENHTAGSAKTAHTPESFTFVPSKTNGTPTETKQPADAQKNKETAGKPDEKASTAKIASESPDTELLSGKSNINRPENKKVEQIYSPLPQSENNTKTEINKNSSASSSHLYKTGKPQDFPSARANSTFQTEGVKHTLEKKLPAEENKKQPTANFQIKETEILKLRYSLGLESKTKQKTEEPVQTVKTEPQTDFLTKNIIRNTEHNFQTAKLSTDTHRLSEKESVVKTDSRNTQTTVHKNRPVKKEHHSLQNSQKPQIREKAEITYEAENGRQQEVQPMLNAVKPERKTETTGTAKSEAPTITRAELPLHSGGQHLSDNGSFSDGSTETGYTGNYENSTEENLKQENSFSRNLNLQLKVDGILMKARYNGLKLDLSIIFKDVGNIPVHQLSGEISHIIQESGIDSYFIRLKDREKEYRVHSSEARKNIYTTGSREINVKV